MHKNDPAYPEHRYVVEVESGSVGVYLEGDFFKSFCVEAQEYTADGVVFDVTAISSNAVAGGPGYVAPDGDPLDPMTAYLYTEFMKDTDGTLDELGYNFNNMASFEALQDVIWHIEEESYTYSYGYGSRPPMPWALGTLRGDLHKAAADAGWTDIGNVRVMNLTKDGVLRQDHLVLIPAPGAMLLSGIGVCFVGWLRRRTNTIKEFKGYL